MSGTSTNDRLRTPAPAGGNMTPVRATCPSLRDRIDQELHTGRACTIGSRYRLIWLLNDDEARFFFERWHARAVAAGGPHIERCMLHGAVLAWISNQRPEAWAKAVVRSAKRAGVRL